MTLAQARTLGGVGSILMLLVIAPVVGFVLWIVGVILVLVAVKNISDAVDDKSIFNNSLIAVVVGIAGAVIGAIFLFSVFFAYFGFAGMNALPYGGNFSGFSASSVPPRGLVGLITGALSGLLVFWVSLIISALFLRRSYSAIADKTYVKMFGTASLIYLIGAALTVVIIGLALVFVALVLQAVAFFSIPDRIEPPAQPAQGVQLPPPPPVVERSLPPGFTRSRGQVVFPVALGRCSPLSDALQHEAGRST